VFIVPIALAADTIRPETVAPALEVENSPLLIAGGGAGNVIAEPPHVKLVSWSF
jgi:hypothetical protein